MTRDPWAVAVDATSSAYRLEDVSRQSSPSGTTYRVVSETKQNAQFIQRANNAADAFDVAADAWEIAGDDSRARHLRNRAIYNRTEAFVAGRPITGGWYHLKDTEAHRIARANGVPLPKQGWFQKVRLFNPEKPIDLLRLRLMPHELQSLKRKRPWTWAIGGLQ